MALRRVTVFGGSGFIGRQIVQRLASQGVRVRVAVRDPIGAEFLKPLGDLGQIAPMKVNVMDEAAVARVVDGADGVVNLIGILYEKGRRTFQALHVDAAERIARLSAAAGVAHMVQISAIGADTNAAAKYARTKAEGEAAVRRHMPAASILRPSVVFGPHDDFFNLFGGMSRLLPVLPYYVKDGFRLVRDEQGRRAIDLGGSGGPRFQPVYVGDVADAAMTCLQTPAFQGQTFELGGPRAYTMREIMELVVEQTERSTHVVPVPFWVARVQASVLQVMPKPLITPDQVKLLETDNIVSGTLPGFEALGIEPTAAEAVLPTYMNRFRPHHRNVILRVPG
ncbi:complex I NDUFA9 subunit family protein [Roseospira marina]|uniref:Complex I NDUFA9 subunit family protein n=1 Tax=Roseospira marina TaxID=140057 RepID=A0A5M6IGB2_9PROT|nr:complex I NDUFA9 subunit family protein [Roseospira marina]KAA5606927.1 complex I NDUFA9 subunit family protein [Roseospira marina]MBB4312900.1 NADH dehydrogenase [Roseospira marina]MBB5086327.1 NADH dehydrogenase [Roseospira marina]